MRSRCPRRRGRPGSERAAGPGKASPRSAARSGRHGRQPRKRRLRPERKPHAQGGSIPGAAPLDARRQAARGRGAARQAAALSDRGRGARPARAPDDRWAASLPRPRREGAEVARLPSALRGRRRTRAHGSRLEEARRGLAADAGGRRGGTRAPRTGGTGARRRRARRDPGFGLAAAPLAASRPARDRRHRPRVGERDPPPRAAVSVRLVRGPGPCTGAAPGRGDRRRALARPRAARARRGRQPRLPRPQEAGRALLRLRDADRPRRLRGAHGLLLPRLPDQRARAQGSAPFEAPEMSEIMQALYRGDDETARRLAETAELDVFEAASLGQAERLRELLAADPALAQARSDDDFTALHYAAFFDGPETALLLVEHDADVNAFADNELGVHPLNSAAAAGQREVAAILLEHGADPNAPTRRGFTPLDAAQANGDEKLAELLRSHGARDAPKP